VTAAGFYAYHLELYRVPRSDVEAPAELGNLVRGKGSSRFRVYLFVSRALTLNAAQSVRFAAAPAALADGGAAEGGVAEADAQ
jgi:hypothetical protein